MWSDFPMLFGMDDVRLILRRGAVWLKIHGRDRILLAMFREQETFNNSPSLITRPQKDRFGNFMHTITGQVIRASIGKGVFIDNQDVPMSTQIFAISGVVMV